MAKAGRKPTPTATKRRNGNPGGRPLPKNEPKPPRELSLEPPTYLDKTAKAEWRRLAAELDGQNLLTSWDMAAFGAYCECFSRYVRAYKRVERDGSIVMTPNGCKQINPLLTVLRQTREAMLKSAASFGLTPSSRVSLDIGKTGINPQGRRSEADKDFGLRVGT